MPGTYNNGFPIGYPYMQGTGFAPYQQQAPTAMPSPQTMPAPQQDVINTNIVPIDDLKEIDKFHLDSGASLMFMLRDNSAIYIKSALGNGLYTLNVYRLEHEEKKADPAEKYLTLEEAEKMFAEWEQRVSSKVRATKKGDEK